jgi:hypothetical protein
MPILVIVPTRTFAEAASLLAVLRLGLARVSLAPEPAAKQAEPIEFPVSGSWAVPPAVGPQAVAATAPELIGEAA